MKCFACDQRMTGKNNFMAHTSDGQNVTVGEQCYTLMAMRPYKEIKQGWIPPKGGPALFPGWVARTPKEGKKHA